MKGIPLPIVIVGILFLLQFLSGLDMDADFLEDVPFFAAIGAFILFRILSSQVEQKKRGPVPMPMPEPTPREKPRDIGFKIPPLKGAPKPEDTDTQEAQEDDEALDVWRRESYERHLAEKQERERRMEEERLAREHQKRETQQAEPTDRRLSPDALRRAVIWSEILGKPKALMRR